MNSNLTTILDTLKPRVLSLVHEKQYGFIKDGKSEQLGGDHDRELLIALRNRSDLIVSSGKTSEIEQYKQPSKPLVLITNRHDAAPWLEAKRITLEDPDLHNLLNNKNVLFETGVSVSTALYRLGMIDQVLVHHDAKDFDISNLGEMELQIVMTSPYFDRHISVLERRGS